MNDIFQTNRSTNLVLHGIGVVGVVAIVCFLLILRQDVHAKLLDTHTARSDAISLLNNGERIHAQHLDGVHRVQLAETRATQFKTMIPAQAGEIDFLSELSELAKSTQFRIRDFRPGAVVVQPLHKEMEVRFVGEGSYSALCRFLDGLPQLQRSYRIAQLNVTAPRNDDQDFSAECQLRLLFALNQDLTNPRKKK
ncbi:Pilus assembly protein, PilO [Novipirellula galeiformis]|uniref:Pilus assembly protein, PilO n=1 Tax=Novipirellula galeiformis TaxID=2528004 RepID=A0A5C6CA78_9BACT|nr:type 4a pilus biogenesis protein PilO [Novipirellula galeiformis]TWU20985.1 Pilus assembly protein, PilO [Novipirellula galeiformis]